jgi:hypothetical protein
MGTYKTGLDLVNGILSISGELTDGSSGYQTQALQYLNLAYKGVQAGGNLFGVDVADPWAWAQARRTILFTMQPSIGNVTVTLTQFNMNGTLSAVPVDTVGNQISVQDWFIVLDGRDEWFKIAHHTVGTTAIQLDMPYNEASITASVCTIVKLDYDLVDDSVTVDQYNQSLDFAEGSGSTISIQLAQGIYTASAYATLVASSLTAASTTSLVYSGSFNTITRLFTFSATGVFSLLNVTGPKSPYNASESMGMDMLDYTGGTSYTSTVPLNGICRLTAPMLTQRQQDAYNIGFPRNTGKIFELSYNTFQREYPIAMYIANMPDKFCVVRQSDTGIFTIRLNSYFDGNAGDPPTRIEVPYIPIRRDLQANANSIPILPDAHRKFLVDAGASMLMADKSDSKRVEQETKAKVGLQALQHHNRKDLSLAGINYGKLVPRYGKTQRPWWWRIT